MNRASTTRGVWPSAVLENFHETAREVDAPGVWGYTPTLSCVVGTPVPLHVSTTATHWSLRVYRDGGAEETVLRRDSLPGAWHPAPADASSAGCRWPVAVTLDTTGWRPGGYVLELSAGVGVRHHHVLLLRPRSPQADILLVAATGSWVAYNEWGGSNFYEGPQGLATTLSVRRPFSRGFCRLPEGAPRIPPLVPPAPHAPARYPHMEWAYANGYSKKYASAGWANYERHFVRWAEAEEIPLDLATQHDLHAEPGLLAPYRCVVFVGHDEYWTWEMRDAVDAYIDAGGRVARFAGNFLWQMRLEPGGDRQTCFKYAARDADPIRGARMTSAWEDTQVGRPGAATFGLNATRGMYAGWGRCVPRGPGGFTVYRPDHWSLAGTDLGYGDLLGAESRVFGYEVDGCEWTARDGLPFATGADGASTDMDIIAMGLSTTSEMPSDDPDAVSFILDDDFAAIGRMLDRPGDPALRRGSGMMAHFRRGAGEVFHAGTCEWVAGLLRGDAAVRRVTRTVLERFRTAG